RRRLPLPELCRRDGSHADELRVGSGREPVEHGERDLGFIRTVKVELGGLEPGRGRDLGDRAEPGFLRDHERGEWCRRRHAKWLSTSLGSEALIGGSRVTAVRYERLHLGTGAEQRLAMGSCAADAML